MDKLLRKFEEFFSFVEKLKEENESDDVFIRGHSEFDWELMPGLGRYRNIDNIVENRLYYDFVTYGGHLMPANKNSWDVLFLMQHHGIPTRLLDWTENFNVALYFAMRNVKPNKPAAIWLLNPYGLNIASYGTDEKDSIEYLDASYPEGYDQYFIDSDSPKFYGQFPASVLAIGVNPPNQRIVAQKGAFTIHRDIDSPLEVLYPECLRKIIIEPELFTDVRNFLYLSGISEFTLFPDLDGLARYIKNRELK